MNQVMTCRFHLRSSDIDIGNEFIMDMAALAVPVKYHGFSSVALTVSCAMLFGGVGLAVFLMVLTLLQCASGGNGDAAAKEFFIQGQGSITGWCDTHGSYGGCMMR